MPGPKRTLTLQQSLLHMCIDEVLFIGVAQGDFTAGYVDVVETDRYDVLGINDIGLADTSE